MNAALIVEALGGAENIQKVDNCYTRLRLILKDTDKVQEETLKSDTGAVAVIKKGENVQVVYGPGAPGPRRRGRAPRSRRRGVALSPCGPAHPHRRPP